MTIETKAGAAAPASPEIRAAMTEFLRAFETFKRNNDRRLSALEKGVRDDVVLREKIARIDRALDEQKAALDRLALAAKRPAKGEAAPAADGRKAAFARYVRAGDASALHALEAKAVTIGDDPDAGYLAPEPVERLIMAAVRNVSPFRRIASVREIGASVFKKPVSLGGAAAGWVGETAARPETTAPTLSSVDFPTMELYAMPAASQALLDDAVVDIEQWLADEVQGEFAAQESDAFVNGDGIARPKGLLSYASAPEASRGPDEIGYIATGVDGAFPAADPADVLLDLVYAPKQAFRANGRFIMNRSTLSAVRKFKNAEGDYLWQPSAEAGAPSRLLGYPVTEVEEMPAIGAGSFSIAFGDFARGYLIVDRQGVRILRDPYTAKPFVLFYTTKRVGGGVQNFDAVKLLKFAVS
ncbi:phage major capsid protein [Amphiplicatus metriothermophilus]|uniref:Phage major capsid protein, HK97 family n=1 Tax=Amphiplicatus metriothermophilus TaxID=1519374 RepID=A0A239PJ37_9PROT|nr:phage major capsid protein [Amphiplicatus metriothermophilus]MBB5518086.1 HK97 family phage major capsid protein [Amphiplicatus metriothermophilus]SNT67580.1 phage major capsid protein, HK97 family [Amphiplicatus metriothermophilus]